MVNSELHGNSSPDDPVNGIETNKNFNLVKINESIDEEEQLKSNTNVL